MHLLDKYLAATPGSEKAERPGGRRLQSCRGQMVRAGVSIREIVKIDSTELRAVEFGTATH